LLRCCKTIIDTKAMRESMVFMLVDSLQFGVCDSSGGGCVAGYGCGTPATTSHSHSQPQPVARRSLLRRYTAERLRCCTVALCQHCCCSSTRAAPQHREASEHMRLVTGAQSSP
jgi:hypothetical protein